MQRIDLHRIGILAFAALLVAGGAKAQDNYPSQTVKFVLPSAPGSTTDILARLTADQLSRKWGKPTVVENIAGGTHEHRRRRRLARGARRLHAVRRAARTARARPSADEEPELQPARLGADHAAGQDRQRAFGAQQPAGEHAPGADRIRQGQSGQAHASRRRGRSRPRICRRRCSRRWRESRCWRCPIAARSRR